MEDPRVTLRLLAEAQRGFDEAFLAGRFEEADSWRRAIQNFERELHPAGRARSHLSVVPAVGR